MMKTFLNVDLVACDELGYVSLTVKKSQLLFDLIAKRSDVGKSVFITSNYAFSDWKNFIGDTVMTKALVGKLAGNAMYPVYGLAEASLAATFPVPGAPLRSANLDRHRLTVGAGAQDAPAGARDTVELVSVGRAIPFCQVRIAADDDRELADGTVGHILIKGDNVTRGYFEEPAVNVATLTADGWLRTGDLGVLRAGELFITGRAKEILFVNGQNYYPHDLESIAQHAQGLDLGKVVIAGVRPAGAQTDHLVVFVLHRGDVKDFLPVANEVSKLINEHTGLEVADVVPVKRIPKTTSGKIQRHLLEEGYIDGEFAIELNELAALRRTGSAWVLRLVGVVESRTEAAEQPGHGQVGFGITVVDGDIEDRRLAARAREPVASP